MSEDDNIEHAQKGDFVTIRTDHGVIQAEVLDGTSHARPEHGARLGGLDPVAEHHLETRSRPRVHYVDYCHRGGVEDARDRGRRRRSEDGDDDCCPVCGRTYAIHFHGDIPQTFDFGPDVTGVCTTPGDDASEGEVIIHVN